MDKNQNMAEQFMSELQNLDFLEMYIATLDRVEESLQSSASEMDGPEACKLFNDAYDIKLLKVRFKALTENIKDEK